HNKLKEVMSNEDIEECVSDVFVDIYKQRDIIDLAKGSLRSYLCVIAKRKAINLYNSMSLKKNIAAKNAIPLEDDLLNKVQDENLTPEEIYIEYENRIEVAKAIRDLGEPDCEILVRKYFLMESSKKIAECFGMSANAVDIRVHRALKKLKTMLGGNESEKRETVKSI
ncbi:MAG: sigma-70 family RNA polymerase sigma factor, partial [Clostridiaceae bacterium]|nr:sigma-70 family RNA polymerase sigma factor [Clostridiaceae bacterium]